MKPNNELIEELEAKGVQVPAPLNDADLAIEYPSKEPVSPNSILARSPALTKMRSP